MASAHTHPHQNESAYVEHPQEHLALAHKILEEHGVFRYRNQDDFLELLNVMQGHRLTMQVVIGLLEDHTPSEVLERVRPREDEDAPASILQTSIEMLYGDNASSVRPFYLCLVPFGSSVNRAALKPYVDAIATLPVMKGVDASKWEDHLATAEHAGVVTPVSEGAPLLSLQRAFAFLLERQWQVDVSDEDKQAIKKAHMEHFRHLMSTYQPLMESEDEKEQQFGLMVCQQEMENVHAAVKMALELQEDILPFAKYLMVFFDDVGEQEMALQVVEDMLKKLEQYDEEALNGHAAVGYMAVMHAVADRYANTPQMPRSRELYQRILKHYDCLTGMTPQGKMRGRATVYDDLGRLGLYEQEWKEAEEHFKKALELKRECVDREGELSTLVNLGRMAHHVKEWKDANVYYKQALDIAVEFKLDDRQGCIHQEWGEVAFDEEDWKGADAHFKSAIDANVKVEDRQGQAAAWHHFGKVAQVQSDLVQAVSRYQEALKLFTEEEDDHAKAATAHQLGVVAMEQEEYNESRKWFLSALESFKGLEDGDSVQLTLSNIARLVSLSGDHDVLAEAGTMLGVSEQDLIKWLQSQ
ncbi:MAG TPA: tetratricopeptide repeat protein [Nitrospirales bacterium]|nr:tetratricopeptide repeat protein [Nitrospirales bacterium]HIN34068.1 tetratricopeptide repeat protein [Nitrospirales bacterium]